LLEYFLPDILKLNLAEYIANIFAITGNIKI